MSEGPHLFELLGPAGHTGQVVKFRILQNVATSTGKIWSGTGTCRFTSRTLLGRQATFVGPVPNCVVAHAPGGKVTNTTVAARQTPTNA